MYNILDKYLLTSIPQESPSGGGSNRNQTGRTGGLSDWLRNRNPTSSGGTQTPTPGTPAPANPLAGAKNVVTNPNNNPPSPPPPPPPTGPAPDAVPVPGKATTSSKVLTQQEWQAQIGTMPSGGWTLADGKTKTKDATKAYQDYAKNFKPTETPNPGQVNVVDYAGQVVNDPSKALTTDNPATPDVNESMFLSDRVPDINENAEGTNLDPNDPRFAQQQNTQAQTAQAQTTTANQVDPRDAQTYEAAQTQQNVEQNGQATAQQGTVSDEAQIDAPQLDMQGSATGTNADGSTNYTGQALNEHASQNISNIIDTSTPSGKALAEALGEGNYLDSKATLKGQLDILQGEFVGPNGEPKIPAWAAATARNVGKIAAFKGMTGTAATAAMAQALMEASIPIAQQDAQFFQTVTLENLSNKQASIINKANVLAKFDLTNLDNRMVAAVENAKAFLQMDMANLDNAQQAEIINTQNRVQSILEDAKAKNAERMFTAESQNDMAKFYDTLNSSIQQFNASQSNAMAQANMAEANDMNQFNAELENNRQQFYKEMQYNIDLANAKWRQSVTTQEAQYAFDAAATDVKNMVTISQEQLNQIWDRSDALLDYVWKSSENAEDRKSAMAIASLQAKTSAKNMKAQLDAADSAGWGSIFGSVAGAVAGSDKFLDFLF
jgi:hypothetical protein